jgi:hypothetical protein
MDQLLRNELQPLGHNGTLSMAKGVIWEEGIKQQKSSIMDVLIPASNLTIGDLYNIKYVKKTGNVLKHGAHVLQNLQSGPQWKLGGAFTGVAEKMKRVQPKQEEEDSQVDTDLEVDEDSMMEADDSWSHQSYGIGSK